MKWFAFWRTDGDVQGAGRLEPGKELFFERFFLFSEGRNVDEVVPFMRISL
jgi:hypothetical protein